MQRFRVLLFTAWVHDQSCAGWQWGGAPRRLPMSLGLYPPQGVGYEFYFCQVLYLDPFHPAAALLRRTSVLFSKTMYCHIV
jgi:hypothetical protein